MKTIALFIVVILLQLNCFGQEVDSPIKGDGISKKGADSIYFDKSLCEYQIDSCLNNLLEKIVDADKEWTDYNSSLYYYSLLFENYKKGYGHMTISLKRRDNAAYLDYSGIIKVGKMAFLCRGNFKNSGIFYSIPDKQTRVLLQQPVSKTSDATLPFIVDPLLQGTFKDCQGLSIYMEIYNKRKIEGYEMNKQEITPSKKSVKKKRVSK